MQNLELKKVPILEMAQGALQEEVAYQMGNIIQNLIDPNTDWSKPRKLVVTLEFRTNEKRNYSTVSATTQTKLLPSKAVTAQMHLAPDENGEICAAEVCAIPPGQQNIFNAEAPEPKIFEINKRA
jgi:hypothetical protein